jgi:ribosome-associated protein
MINSASLPQRRTTLVTKKASAKKPVAKKTAKKTAKKSAPKPAKKPVKKPAKKPAPKKSAAKAVVKAVARPVPAADPVLLKRIIASLEDDKAEEITTIDLGGRSSLCDAIVVASGRSSRHVASIADHLARRLKEAGYGTRPVNGTQQGDWALVDAGDVIVHIFRPEVRSYYDLEGMWRVEEPKRGKGSK